MVASDYVWKLSFKAPEYWGRGIHRMELLLRVDGCNLTALPHPLNRRQGRHQRSDLLQSN
jgi:hypothetical protein